MMSVHLKTFWKLFQIITEHYKALVASPQTDHYFAWCSVTTICSDYCDLPLGSYKKKSQEEPRQDLWSSRKKISIDHVAPQVGQKYQTMIEHMYTVLTWNTYSLSLSRPVPFIPTQPQPLPKLRTYLGTWGKLRWVALNCLSLASCVCFVSCFKQHIALGIGLSVV